LDFFKLKSIEKSMLLIALVWSGIFSFSLWTYIKNEKETVNQLAINIIQSNFEEIDTIRHWIARQGGIYVPISDEVAPNPSLSHLPERDITTQSGNQLTLINTPYILRQLVQYNQSSFNAHMASLDPLNPLNLADKWESKALQNINNGNNEFCEIVENKNGIQMRLLKPARFEPGCGTCHTKNNYKKGDVLGGLTLSLPMQPYYDKATDTINKLAINHGLIWFLGLTGLGALYRYEKNHDLKRKETENYLRQSSVVFSNLSEGVVITDLEMKVIAVNNAFTDISGYSQDEMKQQSQLLLKPEYFEYDHYDDFNSALNNDIQWEGEIHYPDKSGKIIPVKLSASAVKDEENITTNYIYVYSDISERKDFEKTLQHLAQHDHLTDLPNRMLLNDRLEHAMIRTERESKKLAVLFLDLDEFKNINDTMGHDVGDNILIQISNRLKDMIRKGDTLARYGGDEFIVVMEGIDTNNDAINLAEKLISCVNPDFIIDDKHYNLGVSIGISIYPEHADTVSELISNSDKAMYCAKTEGSNIYKLYSPDMILKGINNKT
jgi:diguanylate cyclase (GGDEF)-like protein/PAS domain S-box-containing protein